MAEKCVRIEMDTDSGEVTVGLEPEGYQDPGPEGSDQEEKVEASFMQPAKNLNDALSVARDLLTSDQAQEAENNTAFEGGFKGVAQNSSMGMMNEGNGQ